MTPEERNMIVDLFTRLKAADTAPRDGEAETVIRDAIARHPAAPYLLTQTVLVQEHALQGAQSRIGELERQLEEAKRAPAQPAGGSFLGGLLGNRGAQGPWGNRLEPTVARSAPTPGTVYQGTGPASGGGFLRSALSTAAGVAGGALLFQGIERMLGYGSGPFGSPLGASWSGGTGYSPVVERETVVNNYYGDSGDARATDASYDPDTQDADPADGLDGSGSFDSGSDSTDI
jgi:uncharacterized protein